MPLVKVLPEECEAEVDAGETLLHAARRLGKPMTAACGGNARCSTCRVHVEEGLDACLPRNAQEQAIADRLSFTPDVRLACQLKLGGNATIRRLALDAADIEVMAQQAKMSQEDATIGQERRLAILFSDIRGYTSFSEHLPPYDVIHILDRYFNAMGKIIERNGGRIDNYIGDGLLAVFGMDGNCKDPLNAVKSGLEMLVALGECQQYAMRLYGKNFEIGIGIHWGDAVIGSLGTPASRRLTVIGDSVNFASRIESANKEAGTSLLVSEETYQMIKPHVVVGRIATLPVKGKTGAFKLYEITGLTASADK